MNPRNVMKIGTVAIGTFAAGAAIAANFDNHLQSSTMVSPAQIYQVEQMKTDFEIGIANTGLKNKYDAGGEDTMDNAATTIFAGGIYNIENVGLRTGLIVNYGTTAQTLESALGKVEYDVQETVLSPIAAYQTGPIAAGIAIDIVQQTEKADTDGAEEQKANFNRVRPGVLFVDDGIEAGIAYSSPNNIKQEKADELGVQDPAEVTLHGRYALDGTSAVGGNITNVAWKGINEDVNKDRQEIMATYETKLDALKIEGDLGYKTAFHKDNNGASTISAEKIATIGIGGAADYAVNETTRVGGALNYEFGSESAEGTEATVDQLGFAVRGNMVF